ncbi:MAG: DEAD/DEAH box helicase family protein, partial [Cyanobacteria bacterium P01_D01_bin.6]
MPLRNLDLCNQYRSSRQNLLRDFYIPCLKKSLTYDRAVGFFSSSSLSLAAQGLTAFIKAGGRMRLVASPHLSEGDIEAIESGLRCREVVITDAITRELSHEFETVVRDRIACLSWLLVHGRLEIKIAVVKDLQDAGVYHEKLGIFADADGNRVAFGGSANETARAYRRNFECIDVFRSWRMGDRDRIDEKVQNFEELWQNQTPDLDVMVFPEAARRKLLEQCPAYPPEIEPQIGPQIGPDIPPNPKAATSTATYHTGHPAILGIPTLPEAVVLRDYQQQAIANWFKNKGRGTLKMATGSGKTITALAIAAELYQQIELQALIVVCPYRHLVQQWGRECEKFGLRPLLAFDSVQSWQRDLSRQLYGLRSENGAFLTVITTNATLMGTALQSQLPYFPEKTLIIGDEAHNLGSPKLVECLPRTIGLRLALSATPERYFDDGGTRLLLDYFGPVLQPELTLADALRVGALVRYRYYPLLVELTA